LFALSFVVQGAAQSVAALAEAKQKLQSGQYGRAETELRALVATHPNSPEILENLGVALQLQDKSEDAIKVFERVLKLKRLPNAVALLATDYCRNHEFDRATPLLNEAKAFLDDPNIMANLGPCYLEADQPETAAFVYEKLVKLGTAPADENAVNLVRAHLDLSRKLLDSLASLPQGAIYARAVQTSKSDGTLNASSLFPRAYDNAAYLKPGMTVEELIRLLPSHPKDPSLLYILGVQCAEQADEEFNRAQETWPGSLALSQLIAELKDSQGDRDGAIQAYEDILSKHPDAPPSVHFVLGLLYAERRRWQDALQQYNSVKQESTGSLYLKQRMSEALLHLDQDAAVADLLRNIVDTPNAPFWALRDYGEAVEGMGQEHTAITYLKRASALDPGDALIHYHLLRIYHKLNQPDAAETEMANFKQLSNQPGSKSVNLQKSHLVLAKKFDTLHRTADAEAEWRAVLAIDPESSEALDGLSRDLIVEGDFVEAIALLEDPKLIGQRSPAQTVNLGLAYANTAKLDEASKALRDGLNTWPDSLPLADELAEVLIQLRRSEEAATVLELALAQHPKDQRTKCLYVRTLRDTRQEKAAPAGKPFAVATDMKACGIEAP
jgi:tetratricopeptide (TPR) repeat protein